VSAPQAVLQAAVPHTNGVQLVTVALAQLPVPVQKAAAVATPLVHDGATHITEVDAWVQAPLPLQVPVLPQVPLAEQRACGSVTPAPTLAQVPSPFRLQAWQVPQAAVEQQTPSTQLPVLHSCPAPQTAPLALRGTQLPAVPVQ
jgi:hypothetical protein